MNDHTLCGFDQNIMSLLMSWCITSFSLGAKYSPILPLFTDKSAQKPSTTIQQCFFFAVSTEMVQQCLAAGWSSEMHSGGVSRIQDAAFTMFVVWYPYFSSPLNSFHIFTLSCAMRRKEKQVQMRYDFSKLQIAYNRVKVHILVDFTSTVGVTHVEDFTKCIGGHFIPIFRKFDPVGSRVWSGGRVPPATKFDLLSVGRGGVTVHCSSCFFLK